MGRSARTTIELPGAEAAEIPSEAAEDSPGPGLSLFDASGDARIRLLRMDDKTQKWIPHGYLPVDATEETVLRVYGGGRYWSQLLVQQENGREGIKQSRRLNLSGVYKPPMAGIPGIDFAVDASGKTIPTLTPNVTAAAPMPFVPGLASGGDDLMQVLKAGIINTLLEMMKSTKEMRAPSGPDPMLLEIMKAQAAANTAAVQMQMKMMELMLTRDGGDTKKDVLDTLSKMKDLVAPAPAANGAAPMEMFNTMLETFTRMRDVAEDLSPPRPVSGDPLMDSIPRVVEIVSEQHQMQKAAAQRAAMTTRPTPGPAGGTAQMPVVGTIPSPQPELAMWQRILRQQAARLVSSAVAKHDPDVLAGAAILFAPPAVREAVALFFHRDLPAVEADILVEIPAMAEHREWLNDFVLAAQERLFPEEFADEDEVSAEGNDHGGTA